MLVVFIIKKTRLGIKKQIKLLANYCQKEKQNRINKFKN